MNGIVQEFVFDFALRSGTTNGVIVTPFKIVCHSHDMTIETRAKKQWPQFMINQMMTLDDRIEWLKMKSFLKKSLMMSSQTLADIHEYTYTKDWMRPLELSNGMTKIEIDDVDCKQWTDPEIPYLEITGTVIFDMNKMIQHYFDKKFIKIKHSSRFVSDDVWMEFVRPLPLFLMYMESPEIKKYILHYITVNVNKNNSFLDKMLSKETKIKKFYSYKKEIKWSSNNILAIKLKDWFKLLKRSISKNAVPLTVGSMIAYNAIHKKKQERMEAALKHATQKVAELRKIDKITKFY